MEKVQKLIMISEKKRKPFFDKGHKLISNLKKGNAPLVKSCLSSSDKRLLQEDGQDVNIKIKPPELSTTLLRSLLRLIKNGQCSYDCETGDETVDINVRHIDTLMLRLNVENNCWNR